MLTFDNFQASSVWELPDPDRPDHIHRGETRGALVAAIVNYRTQNGLEPLERLNLIIDNYLCSLPCNTGKCKQLVLERGYLEYLKGGLTLVQKLFYGDKFIVTQAEANARALICKDCPLNSFPDRDMFIRWSDEVALHSVGLRKVICQEDLGNCMGCSCCLKAKVWYKGPFKLNAEQETIMGSANSKCWQLRQLTKAT